MERSYEKLVIFRVITAAILVLLIRQFTIPFDLIAMIIGIWVRKPGMRMVIYGLEVLNLMLAALGLFFGNYFGSLFGIVVSAVCFWLLSRPDVRERFM